MAKLAAGLAWTVAAIGAAAAHAMLILPALALLRWSVSVEGVAGAMPSGLTLRWFAGLGEHPDLLRGLAASVGVGAAATVLALLIGVPAALALSRGTFAGRRAVLGFLLSPLFLPAMVLGVALLMTLSLLSQTTGLTLAGTWGSLAAAHLLIAIPWVARSVLDALESVDPATEEAARGLGAGPIATLLFVTLPGARPGIVTGAVLAFAVSFGHLALSLPLAGGHLATLPVVVFESVGRDPDPAVAAISVLAVLAAGMSLLLGERLSRLFDFPRRRRERESPRSGSGDPGAPKQAEAEA